MTKPIKCSFIYIIYSDLLHIYYVNVYVCMYIMNYIYYLFTVNHSPCEVQPTKNPNSANHQHQLQIDPRRINDIQRSIEKKHIDIPRRNKRTIPWHSPPKRVREDQNFRRESRTWSGRPWWMCHNIERSAHVSLRLGSHPRWSHRIRCLRSSLTHTGRKRVNLSLHWGNWCLDRLDSSRSSHSKVSNFWGASETWSSLEDDLLWPLGFSLVTGAASVWTIAKPRCKHLRKTSSP